MFELTDLPKLNTTLNAITTVLLLAGYHAIRVRRDETRHKKFMLAATTTSALFLVSYLIYHANVGSVPYPGRGALRVVYFVILISHIILAAVNVPMIVMTLWRALTGDKEKHKRIARITFPIWLYVSITGIVVYFMLYSARAG
jgi:putative membrane protein